MKKTMIVWALCLAVLISACSGPKSGVTIEQVQALCQEHLGDGCADFVIEDSESEPGKHFSCFSMDSIHSILVQGSTDREGNVKNIMLMHQNVNVEQLSNESGLAELLITDSNNMTRADIRVLECLIGVVFLCDVIGAEENIKVGDIMDVFLKSDTIEYSGWKIYATMAEDSGIVCIFANFN